MNIKKIFFSLLLVLFPFSLFAQEATTTPDPAPTVENITVNVNVRYQNTLVFSGPVSVQKNSTANLLDNTGASHSVASDSALDALAVADTLSNDFSVSNLNYYTDFSSFFINCIDISSISQHACNNWQYVVNGNYPPMGADKYILSSGDTIYFYFGNAHRVSLSSQVIDTNTPVTVKTEKYDYMNDVWSPLGQVLVGATQPNPSDPYSPLVPFKATSDSNGIATLSITTPGTYNVGLDADYYNPTVSLTVNLPATTTAPTQNGPSNSGGGSTSSLVSIPTSTTTIELASTTTPKTIEVNSVVRDNGDVSITLDVPIDIFIKKYNFALRNSINTNLADSGTNMPKSVAEINPIQKGKLQTMTASVIEATLPDMKDKVATTTNKEKNWAEKLLNVFGL